MKKVICLFSFLIVMVSAVSAQTVTVAQDGSGNYTTIKAAIAAAPTTATLASPYVIMVKNGFYFEKDTIPSNKPFIQIIGESSAKTILAFNAAAGLPTPTGGTYGTAGSATLTVNASDFTAMNITFANTFNYDSAAAAGFAGTQAVAFQINADRAAFKNCIFTGFQDTLYTKGSGNPRHYFKSCYIDGTIDFIFGSSIDVFDSCIIYPKARPSGGSSYITAANTTIGQAFGYVFRDCKLPAHTGTTSYFLGRPWNNATSGVTANNKVAFINSFMGSTINPVGWAVWDAGTDTSVITDAEYKTKRFDGSLMDVSKRISWSKQLADTTGYNLPNILKGWDPCTTRTDFCNYKLPELAIANFKGVKGTSSSSFTWNVCWPMTGVVYQLYRSIDNKVSFQSISSTTATTDSLINFSATDAFPPAGSIYYYVVKATLPGTVLSHITDTVSISSAPTVKTLGVLGSFIQSLSPAAPSATQSYTVKGFNLVADVTVTPPANFEVSADAGTTWFTNANPLVITRAADSIPTKTILVRLNANTVGTWTGNITNITTGTGAISTAVQVSGSTINTPLLNLVTIIEWPMTISNADSAAVRNQFLAGTTPRFNNLYASLGTAAAVPAYSTAFGQAFGASATIDGGWGTSAGGPGGNLNRSYYEEFQVTPMIVGPYYKIRIDSVILNADFYNTNSNTKMAIVYSKDGFIADSTELTGATFATPVVINKNTSGTVDNYKFALNGANGVDNVPGKGFTFRIYFSCGSSTAGRYGMIKDVKFKGIVEAIVPVNLVSFTAHKKDKQIDLNWNTANELNLAEYSIERSATGHDFTSVGSVFAKSTVGENSYQFTDYQLPVSNVVYYRLKMIDKTGEFTYSKIIQVETHPAITLQAYPNPVINFLKLEHGPASATSEFRIVNTAGRLVQRFFPTIGSTSNLIPVEALPTGNYYIQYVNGIDSYSLSFIKK
ncbi:MAG: pectinesterase family protein [Bacteroidota bacterium]